MKYAMAFDSTTVVGESIKDVLITLIAGRVPGDHRHFFVFAGLAQHVYSGDHDPGFADRDVYFRQSCLDFRSIR